MQSTGVARDSARWDGRKEVLDEHPLNLVAQHEGTTTTTTTTTANVKVTTEIASITTMNAATTAIQLSGLESW